MEINLGEEKIVALQQAISDEVILDRVMTKRIDAFGSIAKFLDRPKPADIELVRSEKRLEPFWYASARAIYRYDRSWRYNVEVAPEVESVSLVGQDFEVKHGRPATITVDAVNHCLQEFSKQVTLEPLHGEERDYTRYLSFKGETVANLTELQQNDVLVIAPQVRGSFVVRKLMQMLLRSIDADTIHEERIEVSEVALYLRPVQAFEFYWRARDKRAVIEFDALTGESRGETGQLQGRVAQVLQNDALFDISADVAGTLIPGAGVAIKLGRMAARKAINEG